MGSLRNPVGPLPSSIYWRRRAVLLSVVVLLALLVTWIVTMGGGGGGGGHDDGADGKNPAPSITPGPSGSGPAISQAPGGRDESGDEESGGSGSGSGSGSGDGGTGESGGGSGAAGGAGAGGGTGSGAAAGVGAGDALSGGTSLPDCTAGAVELSLRSVRNTYEPGQTPAFELTARNSSAGDCKVDLGPKHAVLTITRADGDDAFWSSDDCPKDVASLLYRVPAGSGITYTVKWDRKPSAPECATPKPGSAKPGTYLVEAEAPGFPKEQTSFVLKPA
ncbi:hypothetical protein [Streptomyces griseoviridis]|uniref:DUF4232 domain-containing protein n=1 Tax=Streptomyces griseoviridis TaxID=45398 RepID=A0ABT9LHW6_STRGD|nr:hypothetical protein [Streptomyces griseoviridis]MDP9683309.1 hypothetical protein [Streptomyces griseoviridis]GGT12772.1 hypothetical protein GCM10010240_52750 [Streptomyces griseoviridis]